MITEIPEATPETAADYIAAYASYQRTDAATWANATPAARNAAAQNWITYRQWGHKGRIAARLCIDEMKKGSRNG